MDTESQRERNFKELVHTVLEADCRTKEELMLHHKPEGSVEKNSPFLERLLSFFS